MPQVFRLDNKDLDEMGECGVITKVAGSQGQGNSEACTPYSVRSTVQSISYFHAHAHGRIHGFWSGYSALRTVEWFFVGLVPI